MLLSIRSTENNQRSAYAASVVMFGLGLLSKVSIAPLPVALLLLDWLRGRRLLSSHVWLEKVPYILLSLGFGIVAIVGKSHVLSTLNASQTMLLAVRSFVGQLSVFVWPCCLSAIYPYGGPVSLFSSDVLLSVLVLFILSIIIFSIRKTKNIAFSAIFLCIFLLPSLATFEKDNGLYLGSDRYIYLAQIGLLFALGSAADFFASRHHVSGLIRRAGNVAGIVVICILALLCLNQSLIWRDTRTLFENVLAHYPSSTVARVNIAVALRDAGDIDGALARLTDALPDAKTHAVRGSLLRAKKDFEEATVEYEAALKQQPRMAEAIFGLGLVSEDQEKDEEAIDLYKSALDIDPALEGVRSNLGGLYLKHEDYSSAEEQFRAAAGIQPLLKNIRFNLGLALQRQARLAEAKQEFLTAISLDPSYADAYANLAAVYALEGDMQSANAAVEEALKIDPQHQVALQVRSLLPATENRIFRSRE